MTSLVSPDSEVLLVARQTSLPMSSSLICLIYHSAQLKSTAHVVT